MKTGNKGKTSNLPQVLKPRKIRLVFFWCPSYVGMLYAHILYHTLIQEPTMTLKSIITNLNQTSTCEFIYIYMMIVS